MYKQKRYKGREVITQGSVRKRFQNMCDDKAISIAKLASDVGTTRQWLYQWRDERHRELGEDKLINLHKKLKQYGY